jgi:hypothetical protein
MAYSIGNHIADTRQQNQYPANGLGRTSVFTDWSCKLRRGKEIFFSWIKWSANFILEGKVQLDHIP